LKFRHTPKLHGFHLQRKPSGETERLQQRETAQKPLFNLGFFVERMLAIKRAVLAELKLSLSILAVLARGIVLALAFAALQGD
jgi:hypothetical protein